MIKLKIFLFLLLIISMAGCGQTGRLYLPPKVSEALPIPQPDEEPNDDKANSEVH